MDINVNGTELLQLELWRIFRMEQIFTNLCDIGIATSVISLISIFLVGCIKIIPFIKNIKTGIRKAVYQGLSIVFSSAISIVYYIFIGNGQWNMDLLRFILIVIAEVNVLYPLYENLGLRALIRKIGSLVASPRKAQEAIEEDKRALEEASEKKEPDNGWLE